MLPSEKVAIAAHLHVLLRRKTGRVTDTEWMATDVAYATEIVRFARASALQDGHTDLAEWADKLEAAVVRSPGLARPAQSAGNAAGDARADKTEAPDAGGGAYGAALRYVRGIR
jgi:hypothetical protein